ncbi:MAG TPA: hypothetical protein VEG44_03365 [Candidatus Acidoferrales bacterium]|nr:hypothetical protein [Candidatus Acidoferrales bacterium]
MEIDKESAEAIAICMAGRSARSTDKRLASIERRVIVIGSFDFKGDGLDISYNTLLC